MKTFRIVFLLLIMSLLFCQGALAAKLYGQVLYRNGWPAANVQIIVIQGSQKIDTITTNKSGFYAKELAAGEYTLKVAQKEKMIFLSPKGTRVDFRIGSASGR